MAAGAVDRGEAAPESPGAPRRTVLLVDAPQQRVRRPGDLLALVLALLGIVFVLLLAVYANATTQGVTEDVQSAVTTVLRELLLLPVTVLSGVVTFFLPIAVLADRMVRRSWRSALEALATGAAAALLAQIALWVLDVVGPSPLTSGLTITTEGSRVIAMNPYVAGLAGLLTAVGDRSSSRLLTWSWGLLWLVLGLGIVQGLQTLPGVVVAVLLGRAAGLAMRYASGAQHDRATGVALVRGLRRAGLDPLRVVRTDPLVGEAQARAWEITTSAPVGYTERLTEVGRREAAPRAARDLLGGDDDARDLVVDTEAVDPGALVAEFAGTTAAGRVGEHRQYAVVDSIGRRHDVTVLDGDRHVAGVIAGIWDSVRLRGLDRRPAANLRDAAQRAVLMTLAARSAGVRTPDLVGVTESHDSVLLVTEHVPGARPLGNVLPTEIDDAVLDDLWDQLGRAHAVGLAHRDLHGGSVLLDPDGRVWLRDWDSGQIVSSELSRRIDLAQLLALVAVLVGPERALAAAGRALTGEQLASMAPLLQAVVVPDRTRESSTDLRGLLGTLRDELVEVVPMADVAPAQLSRFSVRTVITATVAVVAVWLVLSSLNFEEVADAIGRANPWLMLLAFAVGLLTYVGSAMALVAFSSERIGLWRATKVQVAASIIALVAPAGIGHSALNLRFLAQRGVAVPLAVATVGLVQVSQFVTTVGLLALIALVTGSAGTLSAPSGAVLAVVAALAVAAAVTLLVPALRGWVWEKVAPTLRQVWPRLVWVASSPRRLVLGISGNFLVTAGYVAAFGAALSAFGHSLPLTSLAITYLASNSLGSVIPSPGGIGPVEIALTGGLAFAGIPAATAASVAVLFRLLTFWGRVPLGWVALRHLQRSGDL